MELFLRDLPDTKRQILNELKKDLDNNFKGGRKDQTNPLWVSRESRSYRFFPTFMPETAERFFEDFEIEENTIFVCSYVKTGTTWITEILRHILYGKNQDLVDLLRETMPFLTYIETWKPKKFGLYEHIALPRRIFGTHLPAELVNFEKMKRAKGKIIVPIRNPKDQAISWYHFAQSKLFDPIRDLISSDWSQFLADYIQGKHPTISKPGEWYPEYLLSWYQYKDEDNVLFIHFEDMKKDPEAAIREIAAFLEIDLTNDRISEIAMATSFDAMKNRKGFTKVQASANMMRKGEAGSWKNTFTVAQSEIVDKIIEEKLGHTDIKFRYQ